jgi:hypothetical protein
MGKNKIMEEYEEWKKKHGSWSQAMDRIRVKALRRRGLDEDGKPIVAEKSRQSEKSTS